MSNQKLIFAGTKLSNIVYNLRHNENLPQHVRDSMDECYKEWDEAVKAHYDQKQLAKEPK